MAIKLSKYKQNFFDIVAENFGNLDYIVKVSDENDICISDSLTTGTELNIDNTNLGDSNLKEYITNNELEFNNNYVSALLFYTVDTTLITADTTLITADTR